MFLPGMADALHTVHDLYCLIISVCSFIALLLHRFSTHRSKTHNVFAYCCCCLSVCMSVLCRYARVALPPAAAVCCRFVALLSVTKRPAALSAIGTRARHVTKVWHDRLFQNEVLSYSHSCSVLNCWGVFVCMYVCLSGNVRSLLPLSKPSAPRSLLRTNTPTNRRTYNRHQTTDTQSRATDSSGASAVAAVVSVCRVRCHSAACLWRFAATVLSDCGARSDVGLGGIASCMSVCLCLRCCVVFLAASLCFIFLLVPSRPLSPPRLILCFSASGAWRNHNLVSGHCRYPCKITNGFRLVGKRSSFGNYPAVSTAHCRRCDWRGGRGDRGPSCVWYARFYLALF